MKQYELSLDDAYEYIHKKKAEVVFENTKKGTHLKFNINQKVPGIWYVWYKAAYLGFLRGDLFIPSDKIVKELEDEQKAFNHVFKCIVQRYNHPDLKIYHTGICSVCGRKLKNPESLASGIGPECKKR